MSFPRETAHKDIKVIVKPNFLGEEVFATPGARAECLPRGTNFRNPQVLVETNLLEEDVFSTPGAWVGLLVRQEQIAGTLKYS